MWKHPILILLISFLCHLNATYHPCSISAHTEEVITSFVPEQVVDLKDFCNLKVSDQNKVINILVSKFRKETYKTFGLHFIIDPPVYTSVPACFRLLNNLGNLGIFVYSSLDLNSSSFDPTLQFQGVEEFIESISQWENLHELNLCNLGLTTCPTGLSKLKSLKTLSLGCNNLTAKTFDGLNLPSLEKIDLSGNKQLEDLPESVLSCSKLKYLSMAGCSFKNIPATIYRLANLEGLEVDFNPIINFSHEISSLKNLKTITLCDIKMFEKAEINFLVSTNIEKVYLGWRSSLKKVILNIPEEGVEVGEVSVSSSPVDELIVSPNLAFSKITTLSCCVPRHLPPSYGDQLGWPEVAELYGSEKSAVEHHASYKKMVIDLFNLSECNRFLWKPGMFEQLVFNLGKESLAGDELISLWKMVVERAEIDILGAKRFDYECSLLYLRNLNGESVKDSLGSIKFTYVQYKPTMKSLLSALFEAINNSSLDPSTLKKHVESILRMFQRPQGEQLVYFYHLFKTLTEGRVKFEEFIQNSIAILKDYIFTMTVNLKGYNQGLLDECKTRAKSIGLIPDNEVISFINDDEYYEKQILPLFYYKFSPDWFCQIVAGVIDFEEELKGQASWDLHGIDKDNANYFEHEDIEASKFPVGIEIDAIMIEMGFIGYNQTKKNHL